MSYQGETVEVQASGGLVLTSTSDLVASARPKQTIQQTQQPTQQFATQPEDEGPIEDMSVAASHELTAQQAVAATQALASLHSAAMPVASNLFLKFYFILFYFF